MWLLRAYLQGAETPCKALERPARCRNAMQGAGTPCKVLQHPARCCNARNSSVERVRISLVPETRAQGLQELFTLAIISLPFLCTPPRGLQVWATGIRILGDFGKQAKRPRNFAAFSVVFPSLPKSISRWPKAAVHVGACTERAAFGEKLLWPIPDHLLSHTVQNPDPGGWNRNRNRNRHAPRGHNKV